MTDLTMKWNRIHPDYPIGDLDEIQDWIQSSITLDEAIKLLNPFTPSERAEISYHIGFGGMFDE